MLLIATGTAAALALAGAASPVAAIERTYTDGIGDATGNAPDIAGVVAQLDANRFTVHVDFTQERPLPSEGTVHAFLDVAQAGASAPAGADVYIQIRSGWAGLYRWNGSEWAAWSGDGADLRTVYAPRRATASLDRAAFGAGRAVRFNVSAFPGVPGPGAVDNLPNNTLADYLLIQDPCECPAERARFEGRYRESRYHGTFRVRVRAAFPVDLVFDVFRTTPTFILHRWQRHVPAGTTDLVFPARRDLLPQELWLNVREAGQPFRSPDSVTYRVRRPVPPREGIAVEAGISTTEFGELYTRLKPRRKIWARFTFTDFALPRPGAKVTTTWIAPNGRAVAAPIRKPRRLDITTWVASNRPLRGRWRCILRADGRIVSRAEVVLNSPATPAHR